MNTKNNFFKYIKGSHYLKNIDDSMFTIGGDENVGFFMPLIDDGIRFFSKNFWTVKDDQIVHANVKNDAPIKIEQPSDDVIILKANKNSFSDDMINTRGILERKFNQNKWESFIQFIMPNENIVFEDNYFSIKNPTDVSNEENLDFNSNFVKSNFIYNFYSNKFEQMLSDRTFDVRTIPNIFTILNDKRLDTRTYEENLLLSYGGLIPDDYLESLFVSNSINNTVKEYFNKIADVYQLREAITPINEIKAFNKFILLDKIKNNLCKNISFIPFPFYCDITFNNDIKKNDLFYNILEEIPNIRHDLTQFINNSEQNSRKMKYIVQNNESQESDLISYDLKRLIEAGTYIPSGDGSGVEYVNYLLTSYREFSALEYSNFIEKIKNNLKPLKRKYIDFMNMESKKEIVLYKLEKRQFSEDSDALIQEFWIEPTAESYTRVIDTQLRYDNNYYYRLYAYVLTVGNQYFYQNYYNDINQLEKVMDISNGMYKIKVNNSAKYEINKIEIARFSGNINEFPLTKPNMVINKYKDSVLFTLEAPSEVEEEEYIVIENSDFAPLERIRTSQKNKIKKKTKFKRNKDLQPDLEVYRTTIKPLNFLSFQGKRLKTLSTNNMSSFTEDIVFDVKYYYTFRYINNHNTPSNPSKVYEVEMKNEDGYVYLNVNELNLLDKTESRYYKDLKRYLLIRPSIIQTQLSTNEKIKSINDINIGPITNSIWADTSLSQDNKKFKLRITSKKTNRIIEFDLRSIINRKKN